MRLTGDGWAVARALVLAVGLCYDHWRRLHQMYVAVIENGIGDWNWWLGLELVVGFGIGGWVWYWWLGLVLDSAPKPQLVTVHGCLSTNEIQSMY
jgi:hypothetical protein